MKKINSVIALICILTIQSCAQNAEKKVPDAVNKAFNAKFTDANKVKWEMEDANEWEAEFHWKGVEYSASFTADGAWMETEYEIKKSEIPSAVTKTLETDYAGYKIEEVEMSESKDGKVYEVKIEMKEKEMDIFISPEGKVIKEEMSKDEDDED